MSITCNAYCAEQLPAHTLNDCDYERTGAGDAVIVLECGHGITDPSNATEVQDAINAGKATVINGVRAFYDRASATLVDSNIPNRPQKVSRYERTGTLRDANVNEPNIAFYNLLATGRTFGGLIVKESGNDDDQKVRFINEVVTFNGSDNLPESDTEFQNFEVQFLWRTRNNNVNPEMFDVPVGIFN
jgi:hypothetical protein